MSFNKVIVVGNLGRDPEMKFTPQGTPVCTFSVATNERRKGSGGEPQDVTTWFRVTVWGRQAETVSKYLTKGRSVYVEGRLQIDEWTDKQGKTRFTLEVNATDVQFIGGAGERDGIPTRLQPEREGARSASAGAGGGRSHAADLDDDDSIPF